MNKFPHQVLFLTNSLVTVVCALTCQNGGEVIGDLCHCPFGWSGRLCEAPTYCGNGKLVDDACECEPRWHGKQCDERICQHGTYIQDGLCNCDPGYTGLFCKDSVICAHGNFSSNSSSCICEPNFLPPDCRNCSAGFKYDNQTETCLVETETTTPPPPPPFTDECEGLSWASCYKAATVGLSLVAVLIVLSAAVLVAWWLHKRSKHRAQISPSIDEIDGTEP